MSKTVDRWGGSNSNRWLRNRGEPAASPKPYTLRNGGAVTGQLALAAQMREGLELVREELLEPQNPRLVFKEMLEVRVHARAQAQVDGRQDHSFIALIALTPLCSDLQLRPQVLQRRLLQHLGDFRLELIVLNQRVQRLVTRLGPNGFQRRPRSVPVVIRLEDDRQPTS